MRHSFQSRLILSVTLLALLALPSEPVLAEIAYHVAPNGDDSNKGTAAAPFATLERAQRAVREATQAGLRDDVVVYLSAGTYYPEKTLQFGPLDGGTAEHSVTYAAVDGEQVTISGGREIAGWRRGDDGVWTTELPDVKAGKWFFRQLYADGKRMPRGRYPEKGFLKIKSVSKDRKTLRFDKPLPEGDFGGQDTEVVVVQNWSISREVIAESNPEGLTAETPIGWIGHGWCVPKRGMAAFLENARSLVKQPGQWYLDRKAGMLHYLAAEGEDPSGQRFVAPRLDQLVVIEGTGDRPVQNLHFRGIGFEHTNWLIPEIGYGGIQACYYGTTVREPACFAVRVAVELERCEGCTIQQCRLRHIGGSGIGLGAGCRENRIVGCVIGDIGANGVNIGHMKVKDPLWADWPNPKDVPRNNVVANCYIHHTGQELWGAVGIFQAMTQGARIVHNEVTQTPYTGVSVGYVWNTKPTSQRDCLVAENHIHEVMLRLYDGGAIYTLGFQPGTVLRRNHLHGVRRSGFAHGGAANNGIFFDEGSKGLLVEENVIYDTAGGSIRFNQSNKTWQTWKDNSLGVTPESPEFPKDIADAAGPEAPYRARLKPDEH